MTLPLPPGLSIDPTRMPTPRQLKDKWGWFVALGILALVAGLGALALTALATVTAVLVIGIIVMVVGIAEIVTGFRARSWGQTIYWEVSGIFYVVAGFFAWDEPASASVIITLLLGAGLLATGVVRAVTGFRLHDARVRNPLILSGAVTALLGVIIVTGWPANSLFVVGMLLGIELVFSGITWIFFALRLRALS